MSQHHDFNILSESEKAWLDFLLIFFTSVTDIILI